MKQYEVIGVIITLLGAVLWGVSGASVQFLSNFRDMNLEWLVTMRLITAGLLTVIYAWFRFGNSIFNVFHSVRDTLGLIVFGVFGMALCQYTYFRSIALAGAGIATVAIIIAIPISPNRLNSFPKKVHPKKAAEIGSIDDKIDPGTAPIRLTPSK